MYLKNIREIQSLDHSKSFNFWILSYLNKVPDPNPVLRN